MIDSIDFRVSDNGTQIEIGLFKGEDCVRTIPLKLEDARALQKALGDALQAVGGSSPTVTEKP